MAISQQASLTDVCFAVCTALDAVGTKAVLTGGSAATYYAPAAYQSRDADFVIVLSSDEPVAASTLSGLGYHELGGTYIHSSNPFTLEFPPGPLAVGNDCILSYDTVRRDREVLFVLSRTDCVRDRLAAYYFFNDRSALAAAIAVANSGIIDVPAIHSWSDLEGESRKFVEFRTRLQDP